MGLAIPGAIAFKAGTSYYAPSGARSLLTIAHAATTTTAQTVAAGSTIPGTVLTGVAAAGLAGTAIKTGGAIWGLDWLAKNWYIPAILIGGLIAYKYVGGKK